MTNWKVIAHDFNSTYFRTHIFTRALKIQSQTFNIPIWRLGIISKQNDIAYISDMESWTKAAKAMQNKAAKDMSFMDKLIDQTLEKGEALNRWSNEHIYQPSLESYTDNKLSSIYIESMEKMSEVYAYGTVLPLLDFGEFQFVEDNLKKIVARAKDPSHAYEILTAPMHLSFAQEQEEALLQLMIHSKVDKKLAHKNPEEINKCDPSLYLALQKHTEKFGWVYYVYAGPAFSMQNFLEFIQLHLEDSEPPEEKLKLMQTQQQKIQTEKKELILKLAKSLFEQMIANLAGKVVWGKPRRKDLQSRSYFHIEKLQREIGKRLYLSLQQVRSLPPEQLIESLSRRVAPLQGINEINKFHVSYPEENGKVTLLVGKAAEEFSNTIKRAKVAPSKVITGSTACNGKAFGKAVIINKPSDMGKMEQGAILVSIATSPSLVPAMKKASAIITDEGGLTCHAAIVSRELSIPCIIGTKNASSIIKDGDMLDVDATNAIVRLR